MTLFINACVRENSRTYLLAKKLVEKFDDVNEVKLIDINFPKVDEAYLKKRDELIYKGDFNNEMFKLANEFKRADRIIIASPYWDLSFPTILKQYFEVINVVGITFSYKDGVPFGLCKASDLYYVTTSGGTDVPLDYGYGYVKALGTNFYNIKNFHLIKAEGLDIDPSKANDILESAMKGIEVAKWKKTTL